MHSYSTEKYCILPITSDAFPCCDALLNCAEMSWEWGYISLSTNQTMYDPLDTEYM